MDTPTSISVYALWLLIGSILVGAALRLLLPTTRPPMAPLTSESLQPSLEVREDGVILDLPNAPAELPVSLTLYTPAGPIHEKAVSEGEGVRIVLPYVRAGKTPYRLALGSDISTGELNRQPGPPVTPLVLKVGARSVRVTETDQSALVLHPLDAQQNVSEEPVEVTVLTPEGELWQERLEVENLLAWTWLPNGDEIGTLGVSAVSGEARGERGEVDLLPGFAVRGRIEGLVTQAPANGQDPWRITFSEAEDALGNTIADGSALHLLGGSDALNFFFTRPAVKGGADIVLPTYPRPGDYQLEAQVGLFSSATVEVNATPAFAQPYLPLTWLDESSEVLIGPLWDPWGALPDDGTPVLVQLLDGAGNELYHEEVLLVDGQAVWTPPLAAERVRATLADLVSERALSDAP